MLVAQIAAATAGIHAGAPVNIITAPVKAGNRRRADLQRKIRQSRPSTAHCRVWTQKHFIGPGQRPWLRFNLLEQRKSSGSWEMIIKRRRSWKLHVGPWRNLKSIGFWGGYRTIEETKKCVLNSRKWRVFLGSWSNEREKLWKRRKLYLRKHGHDFQQHLPLCVLFGEWGVGL